MEGRKEIVKGVTSGLLLLITNIEYLLYSTILLNVSYRLSNLCNGIVNVILIL